MSDNTKVPGQPVCGDTDCNSCERWPKEVGRALYEASCASRPELEHPNWSDLSDTGRSYWSEKASATPPAMNAASPTACAECGVDTSYQAHWLDCSKFEGKRATPVGQGSAALDSQRWSKEAEMIESWSGSATSGEVSELAQVGQEFLKWNRSQSTPPVAIPKELFVARKVLDLRAALAAKAEQHSSGVDLWCVIQWLEGGRDPKLAAQELRSVQAKIEAAKAEQSITAGAAKGGNTCDYKPHCAYCDEDRDEPCGAPSCGVAGDFAAPVSERAAAPASVPEARFYMDHGLWHDRVTGQHMYTQDQYDEESRACLAEGKLNTHIAATAPEVAQPAAQGELPEMPTHPEPNTYRWTQKEIQVIREWGASQRQEGRREELVLHQQLAAEKLRSDQGWSRYEEANADRNALRERLATPAPTAGEPSACPTCPKETPYGPAICGKCVEAGEPSAEKGGAA